MSAHEYITDRDFHISTLKLYVGDKNEDVMESLASLDTQEYEIECILDHAWQYAHDEKVKAKYAKKGLKRKFSDFDFKVSWKGFDSTEDEWLQYKQLKDTKPLSDYLSRVNVLDFHDGDEFQEGSVV